MLAYTHPNFVLGDTVLGVGAQQVSGQRVALADFRGHQQANGAQQLKLIFRYRAHAQKTIHVVDGQRKDLLLAALLVAHLSHTKRRADTHTNTDNGGQKKGEREKKAQERII